MYFGPFCSGHGIVLLVGILTSLFGCDGSAPRREPDMVTGEPSKPGAEPDPGHPKYKLWIEATGLGDGLVRLSLLSGTKAVDVEGDGRALVLDGLSDGQGYEVEIYKPSTGLACSLSTAGVAGSAAMKVSGEIAGADATINLNCAVDDVQLAQLAVHTRDAALDPVFEPGISDYRLQAYSINDRMWLEVRPANPQTTMRVRLDGEDVTLSPEQTELPVSSGEHELTIDLLAPAGNSRSYVVTRSSPRRAAVSASRQRHGLIDCPVREIPGDRRCASPVKRRRSPVSAHTWRLAG